MYEDCRNEWKRKLSDTQTEVPIVPPSEHAQQATVMSINDADPAPIEYQIMQLPTAPPNVPDVSIDDLISVWSLNTEQARAFRIITLHSAGTKSKPLRMYIGGPGATGKSRVIQALTDFFNRTGQSRRLRLASFTGAAAKNIGDTTLHAALCMNPASKKMAGTKTQVDLIAMWDGVDYLFIDKVLMIGCSMLVDIHEALVNATGCTDPFGGINMIFAGDFSQLPPIGDMKLYAHLNHRNLRVGTPSGQKTVFRKLLWRSVDSVVLLSEQMQQTSEANTRFVSFLSKLRDGTYTEDDFELLNSRLLSATKEDLTSTPWRNAPIIVSENAVKDVINERATLAFAKRTNQDVQWFEAIDTYRGTKVTDPNVREYMLKQLSGKTGQRLGKFPLTGGRGGLTWRAHCKFVVSF